MNYEDRIKLSPEQTKELESLEVRNQLISIAVTVAAAAGGFLLDSLLRKKAFARFETNDDLTEDID